MSLALQSDDTKELAGQAEELAKTRGGYVESLEAEQWDGGTYYSVALRVPADQLDAAAGQLKAWSSVVGSESWSTEDVTAQVVDLDARTRALRLTEGQLEELLAESRSAGREAEGIMAIFRELTKVREEREKIQGQLAAVKDLVSLSRITLRITPVDSPLRESIRWEAGETVLNAIQLLQVSLITMLRLLIYLVIVVVPVGLLLLGLLWGLRRIWARWRRRKS